MAFVICFEIMFVLLLATNPDSPDSYRDRDLLSVLPPLQRFYHLYFFSLLHLYHVQTICEAVAKPERLFSIACGRINHFANGIQNPDADGLCLAAMGCKSKLVGGGVGG